MEDILDAEPFPQQDDQQPLGSADSHSYDIWDSNALRLLKGPDRQSFIHGQQKETEG